MKLINACILFVGLCLCRSVAHAQDCSNLPTQFTGNEFPSGDFFTNFQNSCYLIPLAPQGASKTDLNDTYWQMYYKVDPRYQLIVVGSFPNARFFSLTANDDHYLASQAILDTNIVPLTSSYVNPFQPFTPYAEGQQYAVAVNFGGAPGTQETGCMMNGYNVAVNSLDATQRHQGMNWNTDPGFFQQNPAAPLHIVDTPQHTNPPAAGYLMVRMYLDLDPTDPSTIPGVIVRDVASGCAYPAAYALQTLQVVSPAGSTPWLDQSQFQAHESYDANYLPWSCYAANSQNAVAWSRQGEFVKFPNTYSSYLSADLPANLTTTLAAAGEVMRLRLRIASFPPTPCTNGCSRSGNEQMRYMGLSFYPSSGSGIASLADSYFTTDANGYATLIVGTGAGIPNWITPANGYTFLDLTAMANYQSVNSLEIRNILPSDTFACCPQAIPYKTSVYTPAGSLIGDYLPVVDYPLAASLPPTASELVGPSSCGALPVGIPAVSPSCGVLPANPTTIASIPAPETGESPIAVQPLPPITLMGEGFGFLPNGIPYTGNSNYLQVADLTQNWSAGVSGNPCNLSIGYWADNRIELVANVDQDGLCPLAVGDQLAVSVWNPQTGSGPVTSAVTVAPDVSFALGTSSALVGSAAGNGAVELITAAPWIATSNAAWLHLSSASTGGVGGAPIQFAYDANPNPGAQTGTLTIAGLTFTVTQAGTSYAPVAPVTALVASGLNAPQGVAVDTQGNVYIADTGNNAVEEWNPGTQQLTALVSGLSGPTGVAVDANGNVYIADSGHQAIEEWSPTSQQLIPLVTGLGSPYGVAVDAQANVYFSDSANNAIEEWNASSAQVAMLLAGSAGVSDPTGVAVDGLGNVYFADAGNNAVEQLNTATQQATALVSSGIGAPSGVAVDGQGNVDFADTGNNAIEQWNAAGQQVLTLVSSGLGSPAGVALDAQGNLYIADRNNNAIEKVTFGYLSLSAASLNEGAQAGADSVTAQVLPAGTPLTASSDQTWLAITGVTSGTVAFTFQANTSGSARVAHIAVLGQQVTITQSGETLASLAKTAGDGQSTPAGQLFPVALEVTVTDSSGMPLQGSAVTFTVTAGPGGAGGTLNSSPAMPILTDQNGNATAPALTANNIGGAFSVTASVGDLSVTFTLTNLVYTLGTSSVNVGSAPGNGSVLLVAGGPWTAASNAAWLNVSAGSQSGRGNAAIYFTYAANPNPAPQIGTLTISGSTFTVTQAAAGSQPVYPVTIFISSGLSAPRGVAVDAQGNVYIADSANNAIEEWNPGTQALNTLVSGLNKPAGVAVDGQGNVYIADTSNNAIKEWNAATGQVIALVSTGLNGPVGVAVDSQGNVYFSDTGHNAVDKWLAATGTVTTLVASGVKGPRGVALDALGNVYIAASENNAVKVWNAVSAQLTSLVASGLNSPNGVAVDGDGNVYIADSGDNKVKQWNAATQKVTTLVSTGLNSPNGVAVDAQGNPYIADTNDKAVKELTPAYLWLSATSLTEGSQAGTDAVTAQVLPAGAPLTATSNETWLAITGTAGGTIGFSFTANTSANSRTAAIKVDGSPATVTQSGDAVAGIAKTAGTGQTTSIGQAFATDLQVKVKDAAGHPVKGAAVTFAAVPGATGASGTFNTSPPMPIVTNASGLATAPTLTANNTAGAFTVSATVEGLTATFSLTIAAQ
jgi:streptogramin lyase